MQKGTKSLGGELPSSNIERSTIQKVIQLLNVTDTHLIIITIILLYKTKENISRKKRIQDTRRHQEMIIFKNKIRDAITH